MYDKVGMRVLWQYTNNVNTLKDNISDSKIENEALAYVKSNQKILVKDIVGEVEPKNKTLSIFMAGSPGAGKTEFSKRLIERIPGSEKQIVRIDPDEIRESLPCYVKGKAELFQPAVSVLVEKVHDYVLSKSISFLLDGTLSNIDKARSNVIRSLEKGRLVRIVYVFQPPEVAWDFTKKREVVEGRNIPKESFIKQFISARDNVSLLKDEFRDSIQVDLIERDISRNLYMIKLNINNIDKYIDNKYSINKLESLL